MKKYEIILFNYNMAEMERNRWLDWFQELYNNREYFTFLDLLWAINSPARAEDPSLRVVTFTWCGIERSPIWTFRMAEAAAPPEKTNGGGSLADFDESLLELSAEEMVQKLERDMQVGRDDR